MIEPQSIKIEQNIRRKVLWPLGIVIAVSFATFLLASDYFMEQGMARLQEQQLQNLTNRYHNYMQERTGLMRSILQQLGRDPAIIEALDKRDRPSLLQHSTPLYEELLAEQHITHFYFHSPDGTNLLRVHKPDQHGDQISRVTMHLAQLNNKIADGIELGPLGTFTLRVVMPVHNQTRLVGYLELGEDIGPILDHLMSEGDDQMAVLIFKRLLEHNGWIEGRKLLNEADDWELLPDHVVSGTSNLQLIKALPHLVTKKALDDAETVEVILANKTYRGRFLHMMDVGGRSVGSLLVLQDVQGVIHDHNTSTALIAAFSSLLAIALFWIASNILGRADKSLRMVSKHLAEESSRERNIAASLNLKQE